MERSRYTGRDRERICKECAETKHKHTARRSSPNSPVSCKATKTKPETTKQGQDQENQDHKTTNTTKTRPRPQDSAKHNTTTKRPGFSPHPHFTILSRYASGDFGGEKGFPRISNLLGNKPPSRKQCIQRTTEIKVCVFDKEGGEREGVQVLVW